MTNGTWVVTGVKMVWGKPSRTTIGKPHLNYDAEQMARQALREGYTDVEVFFYEYEDVEIGPAYGSFSEGLEYDFSQN
jgi:hypothetical protein